MDDTNLSGNLKRVLREAIPIAAILLPVGFFLSVLEPNATEPNGLIYLAYLGAILLAIGLLILGIGLLENLNKLKFFITQFKVEKIII